jgi:two-component system sensor histidine kinase TctE
VAAHVTRATAADIDLGAELAPAEVEGVEWLLSEALDNLIDNALTYTPSSGSVTVRTGMTTSGAFLEVVDSGRGIAPEERLLVLSRFYRGVNAEGAGSGLGLAIVADIARQHAATLSVSAGPMDLGTQIRLQFPRTRH